ncbi:MAG TPA: hemerythrin domain-containing protein [Vicinamibacterales bacterium]|nr:hemerythrin domain-containing protein [Vicinamibacterales bacterium]
MAGTAKRASGGVRREHQAFLTELADLQRLVARPASSRAAHSQLVLALDRFLETWRPRLAAHFDHEESLARTGVADPFPPEQWMPESFRRERETFDALLDLLRDGHGWLVGHEDGAEREIGAALDDLSSLWEQHVRRVDVIGPLLSGHEGAGHA